MIKKKEKLVSWTARLAPSTLELLKQAKEDTGHPMNTILELAVLALLAPLSPKVLETPTKVSSK